MDGCLFCKIAAGEIPSTKVYEDDTVLAFRDIDPQAPVHVLVIPKKHIESVLDIKKEDEGILLHIMEVAQKVAEAEGVDKTGFRMVSNTGKDAQQTVLHLHFHLIGGRELGWPPG